jgi:hypothetical protein
MMYAVEMGSGTMIYISSFMANCSDMQKLMVVNRYIQTQWRSPKPIRLFPKLGK